MLVRHGKLVVVELRRAAFALPIGNVADDMRLLLASEIELRLVAVELGCALVVPVLSVA